MSTFLQLSWPELDASVRMRLLEDRAPKLCKGILSCLPLRSISWHAVISGENMGFPVPLVWTGVDNPSTRVRGSVFLYGNGQLVVIPYGKLTEPGLVNVFGEIPDSEFDRLAKVGAIVAERVNRGDGRAVFVDISVQAP